MVQLAFPSQVGSSYYHTAHSARFLTGTVTWQVHNKTRKICRHRSKWQSERQLFSDDHTHLTSQTTLAAATITKSNSEYFATYRRQSLVSLSLSNQLISAHKYMANSKPNSSSLLFLLLLLLRRLATNVCTRPTLCRRREAEEVTPHNACCRCSAQKYVLVRTNQEREENSR